MKASQHPTVHIKGQTFKKGNPNLMIMSRDALSLITPPPKVKSVTLLPNDIEWSLINGPNRLDIPFICTLQPMTWRLGTWLISKPVEPVSIVTICNSWRQTRFLTLMVLRPLEKYKSFIFSSKLQDNNMSWRTSSLMCTPTKCSSHEDTHLGWW